MYGDAGAITVAHSQIVDNGGAGIDIWGAVSSHGLAVSGSTISNNSFDGIVAYDANCDIFVSGASSLEMVKEAFTFTGKA